MTSSQYQPTLQDNERFIAEMLPFGDDRWVCHEEIRDAYNGWIRANLGRTKDSSSTHLSNLHDRILIRVGVQKEVRGYSVYNDGRKERQHFLGVGLIGQTGTSFQPSP